MKLYAQIRNPNEYRLSWDNSKEDGWYEIEREPNVEAGEYLEYDAGNDCVVIKKREKSAEELESEKQSAIKSQLVAELPDIILQNKDTPGMLAQALCDRAKKIEAEIK